MKLYSEYDNPAYDGVLNPRFRAKYEESPSATPPLGICILPDLQEAGIDLGVICNYPKFPEKLLWTIESPVVQHDLAAHKKDVTNSTIYKVFFH